MRANTESGLALRPEMELCNYFYELSYLTSGLGVGVHARTEGGGGAGEFGVGSLGQAGIVFTGVAGHSVFVMVRLVVRLRVVGIRLVVGRSWSRVVGWLWHIRGDRLMIYWRWRWGISRDWCWFMIYWRWRWRRGVRGWRVCWWRHWRVLSLRSGLLPDSLDWEAVEGGEVLLAVSFSSHEGQEGEGGGQW